MSRLLSNVALAALAAMLTGCISRPLAGPHETISRNVVYAKRGDQALHLDFYVPKAGRPVPAIVWIHGGAWKYGDKGLLVRPRRFTEAGFAVVAVQYRRSWEAKWPGQYDDCAEALQWLRKNGARYGIDAQRLALCGDSSGGHVASLLGLKEGAAKVKAVCALYPPTDLVALAERYASTERNNLITQLFDGRLREKRAVMEAASPVNQIRGAEPPFLLMHGGRDHIVPVEQSRELHRRLLAAGKRSELIEFPELDHGFGFEGKRFEQALTFFRRNL